MNQKSIKSRVGRRKYFWLLLLPALAVFWLKVYEPWDEPRAILRNIERITQVKFPKHSELEIEAPTEFCYVGKVSVNATDMVSYLRQMKFTEQSDFRYLRAWGKYKQLFETNEKLGGFLGAVGILEGKHSWEFAYDPSTGQMWFAMMYILTPPPK